MKEGKENMSEAVGIIKEKFQAAAVGELPGLLLQYGQDERAGVQSILERARKRILAYE